MNSHQTNRTSRFGPLDRSMIVVVMGPRPSSSVPLVD
jgi:hypothetical protein